MSQNSDLARLREANARDAALRPSRLRASGALRLTVAGVNDRLQVIDTKVA